MDFRNRSHRSASTEPEINLIPFIDVLLVVLIFLMLSTTYSKFTELQLKLPTADTQAAKDRPNEIIVTVNSAGSYSVNKVPVHQRGVLALAAALADASKAIGSTHSGQRTRHHHQRRRAGHAPIRHQRDGSGTPNGFEPNHLCHPKNRCRCSITSLKY